MDFTCLRKDLIIGLIYKFQFVWDFELPLYLLERQMLTKDYSQTMAGDVLITINNFKLTDCPFSTGSKL